MSPEAQRIAIAEACGKADRFVLVKRGLYYRPNGHGYTNCLSEAWIMNEAEADKHVYPHDAPVIKQRAPLFDYLNDLNAMHEVTKEFDLKQTERFSNALKAVIEDRYCIRSAIDARYLTVNATASDRAEAFLRMDGKWIEDEPTSALPKEPGRR